MNVAIIGSRELHIECLSDYLPEGTDEIVSGGARGVDQSAREYAQSHGIPFREFLPEYSRYGKAAPLVRNRQIVEYADAVLAFWDGASRGTAWVVKLCHEKSIPLTVYMRTKNLEGDTEFYKAAN